MPYNAETKLGELVENEAAYGILLKHWPKLGTAGPMLNMGKGMSLKQISGFPQAEPKGETLQAIVDDLAKL